MKREFLKLHRGKKSTQEITPEVTMIDGEKFTWIDLQNPDRQLVEELAADYNLNALNIEDCLTKFELPKLNSYDDHIFLMLHLPPFSKKTVRHSQLSIFVGKDFIITIHQGDLAPLVELVDVCRNNTDKNRRNHLLGGSTAVLLHEIIDKLVDDLLHVLRKIVSNLDDIEEVVFDDKRSAARRISVLRREITMLRRIVNPLKKIVLETAKHISRLSPIDLTLYFDDVIDHVDKAIDALEESKETMEIYKDTNFMLSTEKTNRALAVLTMMFTLAIPATIVGTFYGMNVELLGVKEGYVTFTTLILSALIPAGLMFVYFKKSGWLS